DVLARVGGGEDVLAVVGVRRGDDHRVDVATRDQRVHRGDRLDPELARGRRGAGAAGDRAQSPAPGVLRQTLREGPRHVARSDDPDSQVAHPTPSLAVYQIVRSVAATHDSLPASGATGGGGRISRHRRTSPVAPRARFGSRPEPLTFWRGGATISTGRAG